MVAAKNVAFEHALRHAKMGKKARRSAWGKGAYIALHMDGRLHFYDPEGDAGLWQTIQCDLLTDDWVLM